MAKTAQGRQEDARRYQKEKGIQVKQNAELAIRPSNKSSKRGLIEIKYVHGPANNAYVFG